MSPARALRLGVIAELLLLAGGVACAMTLKDSLPAELQVRVASQADEVSWGLLGFGLVCLVVKATGIVGLITLKRWARWPYLIGTLVAYAYAPVDGPRPTIEHGITASLAGLATLVSGAVIALCFYTDALQKEMEKA